MSKCTDCSEYNHEKHYCPKFCDVIRETTKEMQEFYKGEHEKLEQIERIINETNRRESILVNPEPKITVRSMGFDKIREILEQE